MGWVMTLLGKRLPCCVCSHISTRLPMRESLGSERMVTQVWLSALQQGPAGLVTSLVAVTERKQSKKRRVCFVFASTVHRDGRRGNWGWAAGHVAPQSGSRGR